MGLVHPVAALVFSFCLLGVMLYKRMNLGITLTVTALILAFLAVDLQTIPWVILETSVDLLTIAVVLATFGIMLLSQFYKDTKLIDALSDNAGKMINNSKIASSVLPAIIGFLPVAGGALMSAPIVDSQTEELGFKPAKKAYVNVWFRHTIFPVYPPSQVLVITAALTGVAIPLIILRQIPVVIVMVVVGYVISFWKVSRTKKETAGDNKRQNLDSHAKRFLVAFAPILTTIVSVVVLDAAFLDLAGLGFDVFVATLMGILALVLISKPSFQVLAKPFRSWGIYGITLAAYGAFLLRNVTIATGISEILRTFVDNGTVDVIILLTLVPAVLGFVTGSPSGGVAISVSVLANLVFSPKTVALLFMSSYLGYVIVPSHLCFAFTVDYFKCSLDKVYKYLIPSFLISFAAALLVYFLV